jgi:hypothetical protein
VIFSVDVVDIASVAVVVEAAVQAVDHVVGADNDDWFA